jgi:TM2 domain-containing membrane protein YozV
MTGGQVVSGVQSALHVAGTVAVTISPFVPQIGFPLQVAVGVAGGLVTLGAALWSFFTPPAN